MPLDVVEEDPLALDEATVLLARDALADEPLLEGRGLLARGDAHADAFPAATTASTMFQYPVHRQMFPWSATLTSSSLGLGLSASSALALISIPGVQIAALERVVLGERALERRLLVAGQPLDRRHAGAVRLDGEDRAALHRNSVEMDGAGPTAARVAADVRPRQVEVVAEEVDEETPRGHLLLDREAVHRDGDELTRCRCRHGYPFARSDAWRTARTTDVSARLRR